MGGGVPCSSHTHTCSPCARRDTLLKVAHDLLHDDGSYSYFDSRRRWERLLDGLLLHHKTPPEAAAARGAALLAGSAGGPPSRRELAALAAWLGRDREGLRASGTSPAAAVEEEFGQRWEELQGRKQRGEQRCKGAGCAGGVLSQQALRSIKPCASTVLAPPSPLLLARPSLPAPSAPATAAAEEATAVALVALGERGPVCCVRSCLSLWLPRAPCLLPGELPCAQQVSSLLAGLKAPLPRPTQATWAGCALCAATRAGTSRPPTAPARPRSTLPPACHAWSASR